VEEELKRLQREGILSKVEWSDWDTQIVQVPKQYGSVRICGDFKGTINSTLQAEQYILCSNRRYFCPVSWWEKVFQDRHPPSLPPD
jgi:hypothetical protein